MVAQQEVIRANGLETGYLRPIAFYGPEKMGIRPAGAWVHVAIAAWPWGAYLGPEAQTRGIRVKTSSFARHHVNATMPRAKLAATYANSVLASMEAHDDGYDEALLLDVDGFVAEGPGENLFVVKDGQLFEPELTSALTGITRDTVITLARERGYSFQARRLTRDDVYLSDEAFFCGTAAELTPIVELDRRAIGSGEPGPHTRTLARAFMEATSGRDPQHTDWITPVAT
jgi:branched-chain amino acid aminotransferase